MTRQFHIGLLVLWLLTQGASSALTLIPWTDARRIEEADRIVIGSLEIKGDRSIITVEKVLKGPASPTRIVTKRKPVRYQLSSGASVQKKSDKVLWMERDREFEHQPLQRLSYIEEGSPEWLMYHALVDPAPLVRDPVFADSLDAVQVLGYAFKSVQISSEDAPMVAKRLMNYERITDGFPWEYEGQFEVRCELVRGQYPRMRVLEMSLEGDDAVVVRRQLEFAPLDHLPKAPPKTFTLHIDARKDRAIGSLSYQEAAEFLRGHLGLLDESRRELPYEEGDKRTELTRAAINSLQRMRDLEAVPRVIEIARKVDRNHYMLPFEFLAASADPRTVKPMCDLIDQHLDNYPEDYWFATGPFRVLRAVGDPETLPWFEMGVRKGVDAAHFALAEMGGKEAFEVLINQSTEEDFEAWAHGPLCRLVRRSNYEPEPWMKRLKKVRAGQDTGLRAKWRNWWNQHQGDVEIVRSIEEANIEMLAEWHEEDLEQIKRSRRWSIFGILLCVLVIAAFGWGRFLRRGA